MKHFWPTYFLVLNAWARPWPKLIHWQHFSTSWEEFWCLPEWKDQNYLHWVGLELPLRYGFGNFNKFIAVFWKTWPQQNENTFGLFVGFAGLLGLSMTKLGMRQKWCESLKEYYISKYSPNTTRYIRGSCVDCVRCVQGINPFKCPKCVMTYVCRWKNERYSCQKMSVLPTLQNQTVNSDEFKKAP